MSKEVFVRYEMPEFLPYGWRKAVAARLGIHVSTVHQALKRGKDDPTRKRIMHTLRVMYGTQVVVQKEGTAC